MNPHVGCYHPASRKTTAGCLDCHEQERGLRSIFTPIRDAFDGRTFERLRDAVIVARGNGQFPEATVRGLDVEDALDAISSLRSELSRLAAELADAEKRRDEVADMHERKCVALEECGRKLAAEKLNHGLTVLSRDALKTRLESADSLLADYATERDMEKAYREQVEAERDEARAELARLRAIESAALAFVNSPGAASLREIGTGFLVGLDAALNPAQPTGEPK